MTAAISKSDELQLMRKQLEEYKHQYLKKESKRAVNQPEQTLRNLNRIKRHVLFFIWKAADYHSGKGVKGRFYKLMKQIVEKRCK